MSAAASIASLIVPGLGQLAQRRLLAGLFWFIAAVFGWVATLGLLGWVVNLAAAADAAMYHPKKGSQP